MIAVIFEAVPNPGMTAEYLELAAALKKELADIPGFISIERFQSLSETGKVLSLSFWEDEAAVHAWRNVELHRIAQARGRSYIFAGYQLTVAEITRSYDMQDRASVPADSLMYHPIKK